MDRRKTSPDFKPDLARWLETTKPIVYVSIERRQKMLMSIPQEWPAPATRVVAEYLEASRFQVLNLFDMAFRKDYLARWD
jgi:hypothetical protein